MERFSLIRKQHASNSSFMGHQAYQESGNNDILEKSFLIENYLLYFIEKTKEDDVFWKNREMSFPPSGILFFKKNMEYMCLFLCVYTHAHRHNHFPPEKQGKC